MPDKTAPKDLETVLARLRQEWLELADLLASQAKSQDRVIEVEKILLRDASGQYRGKISANPDGSADLHLSGQAGSAWVRLGVNRDGEAFFELKDQKGESSFKAADGAPPIGAGPGPATTPAGGLNPAAAQPLESPGGSPQPIMPAEAGGDLLDESGLIPGLPAPDQDDPPDRDANSAVVERLERLVRQYRRLKWFGVLILGLFGLILATLAAVVFRPYLPGWAGEALVLRNPQGNLRASLRDINGKVGLDLWDAQGRRRATLGLGAEGAPGPAEDVSPKRDAEAEVEFVGFKKSNKYHYPTCKWARTRYPAQLLRFKSAAEAQGRGYIPCPVCKPPPLSR